MEVAQAGPCFKENLLGQFDLAWSIARDVLGFRGHVVVLAKSSLRWRNASACSRARPGAPDWASIEGMGLMCQSGTPDDKVYFSGMSLTDGNAPKADLSAPMKNSDVAFLLQASPLEKYDEYGGPKIVYWDQGWNPKQVALTRDYGVRDLPAASMGVIKYVEAQAHPDLKAAICQDLWGKEVTVGNPSFPTGLQARMDIRKPAFLKHVKDYVKRRIYDVGAREALMDEPTGGIGSKMLFRDSAGCFCDVCNNGFREWLKAKYSDQELAAMGISDIDAFDYRELLRAQVVDLPDYVKRFDQGQLPHMKMFIRYQQEPAREFFRGVRDYMLSLDPAFKLTSNTYDLEQELLYLAEENQADFHGAETEIYLHRPELLGIQMLRLKLADALGIRIVTSGTFWEFDHARKNNLVEVFKPVIATHYASGHQLAVPDRYSWIEPDFYGSIPDFAPFYRFVRDNPALFDDYEAVEQVGVILDNSVYGRYTGDPTFRGDYERIGRDLIDHCIPYGVAVGADGFFCKREFTKQQLTERFQQIVLPRNTKLTGAQVAAIEDLEASGKVHLWDEGGIASLLPEIQPWVSCDQKKVWVLPRKKSSNAADPIVVHVLNRDHTASGDFVTPKANVKVSIGNAILGERASGVECYTPDGKVATVAFAQTADGIEITMPNLKYWNVLKVSRVSPTEAK